MIKMYYGLSGTCKSTTISKMKNIKVMKSAIKNWKYYQGGLFSGLIEDNDLNFSILHLVRLRDFMEENHKIENDLVIERGITDSLYYYFYNDEFKDGGKENSELIMEAVRQENSILMTDFHKVEKILMIQKDIEFVKDVAFQDPYRRKTFKNDPEYYMKLQDQYVEYTKKYNQIDRVIEIKNAKEYLEQSLGLTYGNV